MTAGAPFAQQEDHVRWGAAVALIVVTLLVVAGCIAWPAYLLRERPRVTRSPRAGDPARAEAPRGTERRGGLLGGNLDEATRATAPASALDRFGWVDRAHGVVSIPVDDAIELMVAGGGTNAAVGGRQAPPQAPDRAVPQPVEKPR